MLDPSVQAHGHNAPENTDQHQTANLDSRFLQVVTTVDRQRPVDHKEQGHATGTYEPNHLHQSRIIVLTLAIAHIYHTDVIEHDEKCGQRLDGVIAEDAFPVVNGRTVHYFKCAKRPASQ